jgi:ABC-type Fe3+-hydroxamate transport system substrate-binding protein
MGKEVYLQKIPQRIISLVPSQTELLFDLGLTDEVIGITKFCVHPEKMFKLKPRVGGTKKIDLKKIDELHPDLIIGNKEENEKDQVLELMKHYPVWMSDIKTLDDALQMIASVGEIVNRKKESEELVKKIKQGFKSLQLQVSKWRSVKKNVVYLIWKNPYMCAGKGTFIDDMLSFCGLQNVDGPSPYNVNRYPEIIVDDIKKAKPDLIFLSSEPYPFKEKHIEEFKEICPAANVRIVDGEFFSWYGSRLLHAPKYFSELLETI